VTSNDPVAAIVLRIRSTGGDQLAAVRRAHLDIEGPVLRAGLEAAGWSINGAARELGCSLGGVRSALKRHHEIEAEAREKGPDAPAHRRKR
jgi:transcriptional regulator with GAF, ATPase, and Fis domain